MEIETLVFEFNKTLPKEERYVMRSQLNRSGFSISSNIAEGSGRNTKKHFGEFLSISLLSNFELETQLLIEKMQLGKKRCLQPSSAAIRNYKNELHLQNKLNQES